MLKKLLFFTLCLIALSTATFAQSGFLTGTVTSAQTGETLPAVNVVLTELNKGSATDADGKYRISDIPVGTYTVRVTYIGFSTIEQQVAITSGENVLNFEMSEDVGLLDELVITALGERVNERAITFSTQEVSSEKLNLTQDVNIKTGLAGKVAGVQIVGQAGSKLGDFGEIRIRGAISLTNALAEPLYVVDGVPVDDPNLIDMNNVAEISVLKGPNATALYGQRGDNGAILITTKKADRTGVSVEFSNSLTFEKVAYLPNYQNEYGQGYDGEAEWEVFEYQEGFHPDYFAPLDGVSYIATPYADESWGPKFDGREYAPWYSWFPDSPYYGETAKWEAQEDNIKDFYETGVTNKSTIAFNISNDRYSGRIALSKLDQSGLLPYSTLDKNFVTTNFNYNINPDFRVGVDFNYTTQTVEGDVYSDGYGNQTSGSFNSWFARDLDMNKLSELQGLKTPEGYLTSWNWWGPDLYAYTAADNGYKKPTFWFNHNDWLRLYDITRDTDYLLLNLHASYQLSSNFEVTAGANTNTRYYNREFYLPYEIQYSADVTGLLYNQWVNSFGIYKTKNREDNYDARFNYTDTFQDFTVNAFVGGNIRTQSYSRFSADMSQTNYSSGGLIIPDIYQYSNSAEQIVPVQNSWKKEVYSAFAKASVGYQDFLYVDASYRQDWSSALPSDNNGYGYPSVGLSLVFSELLESDILSYGKFRTGWAQVGNDVSAEAINSAYILSGNSYTNPISGEAIPLLYTDNTIIDPNIKPAINSSFETGLDLRFLDDRISFTGTYYIEERRDEIVSVSLSSSNGADSYLTNAGATERKGVELSLEGVPVQTESFRWDITVNFSKNNTTVTELPQGLDTYEMGQSSSFSFVYLTHKLNEEWGQLRGAGYARDEEGNILYNANGTFAVEQNQYFGSILPDYTGGILNTFSYKNFSLSALIDFQKGGKFFSLSEMWGTYSGLLEETVGTNDKGNPVRDPVAEGGGVHVVGPTVDGGTVDTYVDAQSYYGQWYSNRLAEPFVHDASFIKLRELSLNYTLPKSLTKNLVSSASVGIIARNLWLIAVADDNVHGWDPSELSQTYGENGQLPGTRSIGFNVNINF